MLELPFEMPATFETLGLIKWILRTFGIPLNEDAFSPENFLINLVTTFGIFMTSLPCGRYFITYINDVQKSTEAFFIVSAFNFHVVVYWYIAITQNTLTKLLTQLDRLVNDRKLKTAPFGCH